METWKIIPDTDGDYEVSNTGLVRSWRRKGNFKDKRAAEPKLLKPIRTVAGYDNVSMKIGSRNFAAYGIHQLMMLAFVGPCPDGMEVCHNDGNRTNNVLSNLRYDTRKKNAEDRTRHGTQTPERPFRETDGVKEYQCTQCGEWKPAETGFYSIRNANQYSKCGFASECRKCNIKMRSERRRRKKTELDPPTAA